MGRVWTGIKGNFFELFHATSRREAPLDGIRALAAIYILVFHSAFAIPPAMFHMHFWNVRKFLDMWNHKAFAVILNGPMAVDMFFILSGYLIMAMLVHELAKSKKYEQNLEEKEPSPTSPLLPGPTSPKFAWKEVLQVTGKFFIRRYFRIMPTYAVVLAAWGLGTHFGSCDLCPSQAILCKEYIWTNFVFINNFWESTNSCMGWSWSIAVEVQMYLMSPLIAIIAVFTPRIIRPLLVLLSAGSMVIAIALTETGDINTVYTPFYVRAYSYFLGMLVAFQIILERENLKHPVGAHLQEGAVEGEGTQYRPWYLVWPIRLLALAVVLGSTFASYPFSSIPFSIGIAYFIYDNLSPTYCNPQDWFQRGSKWFLSSKVLYFFAQISYGMYLIHLALMEVFYQDILDATKAWDFHFGVWLLYLLIFFSLTTVLSVISFVFVEKPFIHLGLLLFPKEKDPQQLSQKDQEPGN